MLPLEFDFNLLDPNADLNNRIYLLERELIRVIGRLEDTEPVNPQRRYTLKQAGRLLGASPSTLKRRAREGKLHLGRDGNKPFITGAEILRYVRKTC